MSDRNLPDDLSLWPTNPGELLGIPFGTSLRALRLAYTRLIRIYKPEQYPEHFRRIRAAYDSMLPFARATEAAAPPEPIRGTPSPESPAPFAGRRSQRDESTPPDQPRSSAPRAFKPVGDPEEEVDELWQTAVRGDLVTAFRRLEQLSHQHSGQVDIYQRLWWLLSCDTTLGCGDVPADWLVRGLRATGWTGPLQELYRQAVEDDPQEAFSERFTSLLTYSSNLPFLGELMEWRIRAAAKVGNWDMIANDIDRLGKRFQQGDERTWLRILFTVADGAAWIDGARTGELLKICQTQVKRYEYLAAGSARAFDRFDWLITLVEGYRQLLGQGDLPGDLLNVIRLAWVAPYSEIHPLLESLLDKIAGEPQRWLTYLDGVQAKSPGALALFGQVLDQYAHAISAPPLARPDPETLARLVRNYLAESLMTGSLKWRRDRLLDLCLREALTIEQIAEVAASQSGQWADAGSQLAREVWKDWPVRYISRAWQLFRA
jgi:hypothetical protein